MNKLSVVLIRADATLEIGSGHVMRCAALGMRLKARGAMVHFVCVGLPERLAEWLHDSGFGLTVLPVAEINDFSADVAATCNAASQIGNIDLLIVDHYGLDQRWESALKSHVKRILVIDDLADRDHDCDFILDQNLHEDEQNRYKMHVQENTIQFLGPRYALLRAEFDEGGLERVRNGSVKRLLVFFGGTDPGNQTIKVINALHALGSHAPESTILLGPANPYRDLVHESVVGMPNINVLDATDKISRLMMQADLAIGTCGVAAWERCAIGLPCLVVVTAENQREDAEILHRLGAVEHMGDADEVGVEKWESALRLAMSNPHRIQAMALAASKVMTGRHDALTQLEAVLTDDIY